MTGSNHSGGRSLRCLITLCLCGAAQADNLANIYSLSLQNDPTIRAAEATFRAGQEDEKLGRSRLLPRVNASGAYNYSDSENRGGPPWIERQGYANNDSTNKTTSWGVNLNHPLFDMPAWFGFSRGKELTRQTTAQFAADQQNLIIRVAEAYFEVLRALDNLNASRANERANQRQLDQTQQRFDVGLIAITDVHESRAAYDLAVAQRLSDEGNLGVALERLSVLTGQRHDKVWLLKSDYPIVNPDPTNKDEWVNFALENNFTVKATAYARDAAYQLAREKKYEHAPKLGAQLGYNESYATNHQKYLDLPENGENPVTYPSDVTGPSIALNLNVPLYSGGFISASRRQAYEQYNRAQEVYAGTVRNTVQATRALHLQTSVDVATVKARQLAIVSSKSAYEATQAGYEVGTRNIVDVLNVQQNLFVALRDYANARYNYVLDMLKLKNQAGLLSPDDINNLNQWLEPPAAPTLSETGLSE